MSINFFKKERYYVEFQDIKFALNTEFKRVLSVCEVLSQTKFLDEAKIWFCLKSLLTKTAKIKLFFLKKQDKIGLTLATLDRLSPPQNEGEKSFYKTKTLSLKDDSDLIFSAFLSSYGINLKEQKILWDEFLALLKGVSKDTALYRIISLRTESGTVIKPFDEGLRDIFSAAERIKNL